MSRYLFRATSVDLDDFFLAIRKGDKPTVRYSSHLLVSWTGNILISIMFKSFSDRQVSVGCQKLLFMTMDPIMQ